MKVAEGGGDKLFGRGILSHVDVGKWFQKWQHLDVRDSERLTQNWKTMDNEWPEIWRDSQRHTEEWAFYTERSRTLSEKQRSSISPLICPALAFLYSPLTSRCSHTSSGVSTQHSMNLSPAESCSWRAMSRSCNTHTHTHTHDLGLYL